VGLITDLTITAGEEGILIHTTMLRGVFEFGIHIGCRCYADTTGFHRPGTLLNTRVKVTIYATRHGYQRLSYVPFHLRRTTMNITYLVR